MKNLKNVGYHHWVNEDEVVLFLVGAPHELVLANVKTGEKKTIAKNIGRCFGTMPNGNMLYVSKKVEGRWDLKEFNVKTKQKKYVSLTLPAVEDFVVLVDGTMLMAQGSKLYKSKKPDDRDWVEIMDFDIYGIDNISRLAVSKDGKIALVVN